MFKVTCYLVVDSPHQNHLITSKAKLKKEINRLQHIKRFLYFNGNTEIYDSTSDKLYSIGAIIDLLKRKFSEFVPSEYLCID